MIVRVLDAGAPAGWVAGDNVYEGDVSKGEWFGWTMRPCLPFWQGSRLCDVFLDGTWLARLLASMGVLLGRFCCAMTCVYRAGDAAWTTHARQVVDPAAPGCSGPRATRCGALGPACTSSL
jgi:hypothetical protein